MYITRISTPGPMGSEVIRRGASCHSPAVRPSATPVVCGAARCLSLAKARSPQHERRQGATRQMGMSSCTMVVAHGHGRSPGCVGRLRRARLCASHAA